MGHTTCGRHGARCCWRCDRCGTCERERGRLGRGDYCADCRTRLVAEGFVWSAYCQNFVKPEERAQGRLFIVALVLALGAASPLIGCRGWQVGDAPVMGPRVPISSPPPTVPPPPRGER
jgi:hypothetical protein